MMNNIDTSQLLIQMRAAAAQAQSPSQAGNGVNAAEGSANFSSLLSQSIDKVNTMQQQSGELTRAFEMGSADVTLPEVMIAKNKAGLAFEGMVQVRNKMVEAYQEIMRMQV
jgi:flagellar hook-basal body complex protein FliE